MATGTPTTTTTPQSSPSNPPSPAVLVDRPIVFGHTVNGTPLVAVEIGNPARPAVLVVGCSHGDEPAGTALVDQLQASPPASDVHLWLVRSLNPDGQAAATRTNADHRAGRRLADHYRVIEGARRHLLADRLDITGARWCLAASKPSCSYAPSAATATSTTTGASTWHKNDSEYTSTATPTTRSPTAQPA